MAERRRACSAPPVALATANLLAAGEDAAAAYRGADGSRCAGLAEFGPGRSASVLATLPAAAGDWTPRAPNSCGALAEAVTGSAPVAARAEESR
jgi:hypothetical protein